MALVLKTGKTKLGSDLNDKKCRVHHITQLRKRCMLHGMAKEKIFSCSHSLLAVCSLGYLIAKEKKIVQHV